MWFAQREVPMNEDASGPFLPWIVAVLVYLAALALAATLLLNEVTARWQQDLAGGLTVQVPPPEPGSDLAARAGLLDRLVAALEANPQVASAKVLSSGEMMALLEPWLGETAAEQDLPLPSLIAAELSAEGRPDLDALTAELQAIDPGVFVDDHQRWLGDLLALSRSVALGAAVVLALVMLCAVVTVVFLTRTGLAIHQAVIDLLHLIGAQDSYVARQFQAHALRLGLRGGVIGLALAIATILAAGAWLRGSGNEIFPDVSLSPLGWGALFLLPPVTALVAMLTARITVLRSLSRLP